MIKGAEATIEIEDDKVLKKREPKNYRHSELDNKIRTDRTSTEVRLIKDAKLHNVNAP
jgi:N6-L-threonylcarbamoyladenine synthase/protein kinase Bud32